MYVCVCVCKWFIKYDIWTPFTYIRFLIVLYLLLIFLKTSCFSLFTCRSAPLPVSLTQIVFLLAFSSSSSSAWNSFALSWTERGTWRSSGTRWKDHTIFKTRERKKNIHFCSKDGGKESKYNDTNYTIATQEDARMLVCTTYFSLKVLLYHNLCFLCFVTKSY